MAYPRGASSGVERGRTKDKPGYAQALLKGLEANGGQGRRLTRMDERPRPSLERGVSGFKAGRGCPYFRTFANAPGAAARKIVPCSRSGRGS
jgi:hypothetical protein